VRVLALIDGEHHPGVVREALDRLASEHDLRAVLFVGGEEKVGAQVLADPPVHYGREVFASPDRPAAALRRLAETTPLDSVIDLSGPPVLDGQKRSELASVALFAGLEYRAPGLRLTPPPRKRVSFDGPVIQVIGTGKRTGKTAIAGHYASLLRDTGVDPMVVAMGRGGPAEPQVVHAGERPGLDYLKAIVAAGGHAASDYLEDAVLSGVSCVGARRCGDGPAGETNDSTVMDAIDVALALEPDLLLLEGSGAALPGVEAHRTICVTNALRARREALAHLGPYRLLLSDLVAIVGADQLPATELDELKRSLEAWCDHDALVGCRLEPEPADAIPHGARAALFVTAPPEHEAELTQQMTRHGADVRVFSANLAKRAGLQRDLMRADSEGCDLYLTELKAAAIEVVAAEAERRGAALTFIRNRPVALAGERDLDDELLRLHSEAREAGAAGEVATTARES
jgi:cyclic 2,3-diphosphoglycerate synthase